MKTIGTIIITLILVLGAGWLLFTKGNVTEEQKLASQPGDFSHVPTDEQLLAGLNNAGLEALSAEGAVLHIHQHLDININGKPIVVPGNIGVGASFISPLHTHDTSGIIHVESPAQKDFTLGQLFTEWGIKFDNNCISTFCADQSNKLVVAVNGAAITEAKHHILQPHGEIQIWYGPSSDNPSLIPSYSFPGGL